MRKNICLNIAVLCLLVGLAGCTGPEGPMGPTGVTGATGLTGPEGPAGPGNQFVDAGYLVPSEIAGYFTISCPEIHVDTSSYICSTVCVYMSWDQIKYESVPTYAIEDDDSRSDFYYKIKEGELELHYYNDGGRAPSPFHLSFTVINP